MSNQYSKVNGGEDTLGMKRSRVSGRSAVTTKKSKSSNEHPLTSNQDGDLPEEKEHSQFDLASTKIINIENLMDWFRFHKFSGLEHLQLMLSSRCADTLGCFAKKDFKVGDILFTVPQKCILGLGSAMDHPLSNFIYNEAKKHQCFDRVTVEFIIWLVMIDGKYRDHENENDEGDEGDGEFPPIHAYLNSLADPSPSLLHWNPQLLKIVEHTNLGNSLIELDSSLRQYTTLLQDLRKWNKRDCERLLPLKFFNYENLVWACGHYLSRRYPSHFANQIYSDLTIDDNKFSRETSMGNLGSLVPLLDILNHNDEQEYLKFEVSNGTLHVICNHPIKNGDELFSNYGSLSNEQLLYAYGYAIPQNRFDVYPIKLKVPSVMPSAATKKRGSIESISKVFNIHSGGWDGIPKNIFEALGALTQVSDPSYCPSKNEEGVYVNECGILLDYLMAIILKMAIAHPGRSEIFEQFGVELDMKFPTDSVQEQNDDEQHELVLDEESLVPHATIKQASFSSKNGTSIADMERAKYLAFYLLSQYQILMIAAHDLNDVVGDSEIEEDEEPDE